MTNSVRRRGKLPRRRWESARWAVVVLALLVTSCGGEEKEAPLPPSPPVVEITMREYRYEHKHMVPRGRVVFRAHNRGRKKHEILLVPLPESFPPIDKQLRSKKRRGLGTLAYLRPLRPGQRDAFAADLVPGRYAMIDLIKHRDGESNALKGMNSEFRVR